MNLSNPNVDIYAQIVDNYGDAGIAFRLARALKVHQPERQVRLFIDELETLHGIAPDLDPNRHTQHLAGIEIRLATQATFEELLALTAAPLLIEALGCSIPDPLKEKFYNQPELILSLEHFTAEKTFDALHGLSAPTGQSTPRYIFAHGVSRQSGGLIIEDDLAARLNDTTQQQAWRAALLAPYHNELPAPVRSAPLGTLFGYPRDLAPLLDTLRGLKTPQLLFVLGHLSQTSITPQLANRDAHWRSPQVAQLHNITLIFPGMLPYEQFDRLILSADYNWVRGEDSICRAILAGKPFLWHSYVQENNHQLVKVDALLSAMATYTDQPDRWESYCRLMRWYNGGIDTADPIETTLVFFKEFDIISHCVTRFRQDILTHGGIIPNLETFILNL